MPDFLILAPFRGITGKVYRNSLSRHIGGFDEMYAPFVSGPGVTRINPSKLSDVVPMSDNLTPTVPQIISSSAEEIILFAKTLHKHGYSHINWNLGCPFEHIADKMRGCGLLPYPDILDAILKKVFSDIPLKLSVKTRLGYRHSGELTNVMKVLNNYPIHSITLHPRTGFQKYQGEASLEGFAAGLEMSAHPLIYNGDIFSRARYHYIKNLFPQVISWMPGRGALINPFLALQIKGIHLSDDEKRIRLASFHSELYDKSLQLIQHPHKHLGWMKAIWYYMAGIFTESESLFLEIKRACDQNAYRRAVETAMKGTFSSDVELEKYFRQKL